MIHQCDPIKLQIKVYALQSFRCVIFWSHVPIVQWILDACMNVIAGAFVAGFVD